MRLKAAYIKGRGLAFEAIRAANALRWGPPVAAEQSKSAIGLPLVIHFKDGNRAIMGADMTISLVPAKK